MFLIDDLAHRDFLESLAVLTYFFIGSLNETKLNSLAIKELNGDPSTQIESRWYVDGRPFGYQIDGITSSSDNIRTRSKSLWRLKKSGGFITTPRRLLQEYEEVRKHPIEEESRKGDITSMLMFTRSIYKHQMQQSDNGLLEKFVNGRNSLIKKKCHKRQEANRRMLKRDLAEFTFHPEYDSYSPGFSMNIKTELYRFPSIVLLDIASLMRSVGEDSWTTLSIMGELYSKKFVAYFRKVLGLACFARLQCYLAMDSHSDSFRVSLSKVPAGTGCVGPSFGFSSERSWEMNIDSFYELCKDLLTLQLKMKHSKAIADSRHDIAQQLSTIELNDDPLTEAMAHYYCGNWSAVIDVLENYYRDSMDYIG